MSPPTDLSIIIVNWNAGRHLAAALDALYAAQGTLHLETLLIDNASEDDSVTRVQTQYPQVQIIINHENRGFAAACNQGIARAQGRYILLLNPDARVPPRALQRMIAFMDAHPRVGATGPRLQDARGRVQGGAAGREPDFRTIVCQSTLLHRLLPRQCPGPWLSPDAYRTTSPISVDWVSGACMMLRRQALQAAGPLDERFFMYMEDIELCRRIRGQQYAVMCLPDVHVVHEIGVSARQRGPAFAAEVINALDMDLRTRYNRGQTALLHLIAAGGYLLRWLAGPVGGQNREQTQTQMVYFKTSLARMVRPAPFTPGPRVSASIAPDQSEA